MSEEIWVREMEFNDLRPVFDLGEELFTAENWPVLYRTWDEYEIMERFISDGDFCLVAEVDEKVAGFIIGTVVRKRRSPWVYGYILWLGVDPKKQKLGIANKLLSILTRRLKKSGVNLLMADTSPANPKAIKFFEKSGFGKKEDHIYLYRNLLKKKTSPEE